MKIDRKELFAALSSLKPAIVVGGLLPEFSHIWFDGDFIYACSIGFGIRKPFRTDFTGGVPGAALMGLLGSSAVDDVILESPSQDTLTVKLGKSLSKLVMLPGDRKIWAYPSKISAEKATVLSAAFLDGLTKLLVIKALSPTRVEHQGVMVVVKKSNKVELYSTDSASMARVIVNDVNINPFAGSMFMLPRDFARQLAAQDAGVVSLNVMSDCIIADLGAITLYANLLDVSLAADMSALFNNQTKQHPEAIAIPEGLAEALKRAAILAGPEEVLVHLSIKAGGVDVTGSYKLGTLKELLSLEGAHPPAFMKVNAQLLQRSLNHAQTFSISGSSLLLQGECDFLCVIAGRR